jgi:cupin 2 domain-containing protein
VTPQSLFLGIPSDLPEELCTAIHEAQGLRIERIVSQGHCSPQDFWYDQNEHEWVLLLQGNATMEIEGEPEPVRLQPGVCLSIPAHTRHRVASTSPAEKTIWLAIYHTA